MLLLTAISGVAHKKPDDELFAVDVEGDAKGAPLHILTELVKKQLTKRKKLRVDEILEQRSAFPAPKDVRTPKWQKSNKGEKKAIERLAKRIVSQDSKSNKIEKVVITDDLWGENTSSFGWLISRCRANAQRLHPKESQSQGEDLILMWQAPKTIAAKIVDAPAVEVAHPGASYIPKETDRKELLEQAMEVEVLRHKKRMEIDDRLSYRPEVAIMVGGLFMLTCQNGDDYRELEESSTENEIDDAPAEDTQPDPGVPKNKKKKIKVKEENALGIKKKQIKKFNKDLDNIKVIANTVANTQKKKERLAKIRKVTAQEKAKMPRRRIGKHRYTLRMLNSTGFLRMTLKCK